MFKVNLRNTFGVKKMADSTSKPLHKPTVDRWSYGDGIIPQSTINICGWNVNGIRSILSKSDFSNFLKEESPDIMCLNETKIDLAKYEKLIQKPFEPLMLTGYSQYWNFCKVSSGYSGVAIFSKHKPIDAIQDLQNSPHLSLQGRALTLNFQKFYLLCCYKPNSGRQLDRLNYRVNQYDSAFASHVANLQKKKPVIIVGDMNVAHKDIDVYSPKKANNKAAFTKEEKESFDRLLALDLVDTFRQLYPQTKKYTWWRNSHLYARVLDQGWRIDYILSDKRLPLLKAAIRDKVMGSDHCPVVATIQIG